VTISVATASLNIPMMRITPPTAATTRKNSVMVRHTLESTPASSGSGIVRGCIGVAGRIRRDEVSLLRGACRIDLYVDIDALGRVGG
jgi:hypothetical protein